MDKAIEIISGTGMGGLTELLMAFMGGGNGSGGPPTSTDLRAQIDVVRDTARRLKESAIRDIKARARATVETGLLFTGLDPDAWLDIEVTGPDGFEVILDDGADITLGELNALAKTFRTTAITLYHEWRASRDPDPCLNCGETHGTGADNDIPWSGERIVLRFRGVGIDLQNPAF